MNQETEPQNEVSQKPESQLPVQTLATSTSEPTASLSSTETKHTGGKTWKIIGAVLAGVIVFFAVLAGYNSSKKPDIQKVGNDQSQPAVSNVDGNATASEGKTFSFLNTEYALGYTVPAKEGGQVSYEFVPKGETVDAWTKLITITGGVDKGTPEKLDFAAETMLSILKSKNVFVYNSFTFDDGTTKRSDVITAVFPGNPAEVSITKMFINDDGYITADTYAVKITGADDTEVAKAVDEYLATTRDIGTQFIKHQFPEPWK